MVRELIRWHKLLQVPFPKILNKHLATITIYLRKLWRQILAFLNVIHSLRKNLKKNDNVALFLWAKPKFFVKIDSAKANLDNS